MERRFGWPIYSRKGLCIKVDILVDVVALAPKSTYIPAGTINGEAEFLESTDKSVEMLFMKMWIFQRDYKEITLTTDGMGCIGYFLDSTKQIFD